MGVRVECSVGELAPDARRALERLLGLTIEENYNIIIPASNGEIAQDEKQAHAFFKNARAK
jgi:hypothetical protein